MPQKLVNRGGYYTYDTTNFGDELARALLGIGDALKVVAANRENKRRLLQAFEALDPDMQKARLEANPRLKDILDLPKGWQPRQRTEEENLNLRTARAQATTAEAAAADVPNQQKRSEAQTRLLELQTQLAEAKTPGELQVIQDQAKAVMSSNPWVKHMQGYGKSFEETQRIIAGERYPDILSKELEISVDPNNQEAIDRKALAKFEDFKKQGFDAFTAKKAADAFARNDWKGLQAIPDRNLRTLAEKNFLLEAEQLQQTKAQFAQAQRNTIASITMSLVGEKNLPERTANNIARSLVAGKQPEMVDSAILDFANQKLNMHADALAQERLANLKDNDLAELRQGLGALGTLGKDSKAAKKSADELGQRYAQLLGERYGLKIDPNSPGLFSRALTTVGKYIAGGAQAGVATAQDAMTAPKEPSLVDRVLSDALGPQITSFVQQMQMDPMKFDMSTMQAEALGKAAGAAGRTLPSIEGFLENQGAKIPGVRMIVKQALEQRASALMMEHASASPIRQAEILRDLEVLRSQLEKLPK